MNSSKCAPDKPGTPRKRRLVYWLGGGVAGLIVLFALVVFVLPTPAARYVIESQLDELGISHGGVNTIDIDLWNSQVAAGPLRFHGGEERQGQLGVISFDYDFSALFDGRAFVRTFSLRGVDIYVARQANGSLELNGVNLEELAANNQDGPESKAAADDADAGFGFGVERFEFAESRLVFEDFSGSSLIIDLDRLLLRQLHSWDPDDPTEFSLSGHLNDIDVAMDGTVSPLSDPIEINLNSEFTGVTIERLARFLGPTGLVRQDGSVDTVARYRFSVHRNGLVEGNFEGRYTLNAFDIETAEGDQVRLDGGTLDVALDQTLRADDSVSSSGRLALQTGPVSVSGADGSEAEFASLDFEINELDFDKRAEEREWERLDFLGQDAASGAKAPTVIDLLVGWATTLAADALSHQLEVSGQPVLRLAGARIRTPAAADNPSRELRVENLTISLGDVVTQTMDDGWSGRAAVQTAIDGVRMDSDGPGGQVSLAEARIEADAVEISASPGRTALQLDLATVLHGLEAGTSDGAAVSVETLSLGSDGLTIERGPDAGQARGSLSFETGRFEAARSGTQESLSVRGERFALTLAPLEFTGDDGGSVALGGAVSLTGLDVESSGATAFAVGFDSAESVFNNLRASPLGPSAALDAADIDTQVDELRVGSGSGPDATRFSVRQIENVLKGITASGLDSDQPSVALTKTTRISGIEARAPITSGRIVDAAVGDLAVILTELSISGAEARAKGDLEAGALSAKTTDENPQTLDIDGLSISGLSVDTGSGASMESIALETLAAVVSLPLAGAADADDAAAEPEPAGNELATETPPEAAGETLAPGEEMHISVGTFTISPGSRIDVTDTSVTPPLRKRIAIDDLRVGPIDTAAPDTETELLLAATIDEQGKAGLSGWASPWKPTPDFEIESRLEGVSLPPFSPYAAQAAGIEIESGDLAADLTAKAGQDGLAGKIDVLVRDLFVAPVSEEASESVQSSLGVPVGFAVGVLKNDKGEIDLGFPISGTLDSPQVDYSEAISKAISGAMASVLPTSWFGEGGNSYRMEHATFVAGTTELTENGKEVSGHIGRLLAEKPKVRIRACGRAGRADLMALRSIEEVPAADAEPDDELDAGADAEPNAGAGAEPDAEPDAEPNAGAGAEDNGGDQEAATEDDAAAGEPAQEPVISKPSPEEVDALLALATERGAAIRRYLAQAHGIEPERLPTCRTTYSIDDGKAPRAEFHF